MRYWLDTEFFETVSYGVEFISAGIVSADGRSYYAQNKDFNLERLKGTWHEFNTLPHLVTLDAQSKAYSIKEIGNDIKDFLLSPKTKPEVWAYYGFYDWWCVTHLYGTMQNLPSGFPFSYNEMITLQKTLSIIRGQWIPFPDKKLNTKPHHALYDAYWDKLAWNHMMRVAFGDQHELPQYADEE